MASEGMDALAWIPGEDDVRLESTSVFFGESCEFHWLIST